MHRVLSNGPAGDSISRCSTCLGRSISLPVSLFPTPRRRIWWVVRSSRCLCVKDWLVRPRFIGTMDMRSRCSAILGLVVLLACGARAADDTSCLAQLAACGSYLNSTTKPDKSCCNPLVTVIEKDPQCLCGLLTGGTVKQLGVNVTRALELPVECGKNVSATQCSKTSGGSSPAGGSGGGSRNTSSAGPSTSSDKSDAKAASGRSSAEIIQAVTFGLAVAALQIFTVDFHGLH